MLWFVANLKKWRLLDNHLKGTSESQYIELIRTCFSREGL